MNKKLLNAFSLFVVLTFSQSLVAQGLNWDGQTGALLTPFAYTATSGKGFAKPEIAFHYLNSGKVIGNDYQFSVTEGFAKRFEVGFTQSVSSAGSISYAGSALRGASNYAPSMLFTGGYTTLHGKATIVNENAGKTKWVPAIAIGAVGRFNDERVYWDLYAGGPSSPKGTNADFYIVGTKVIPHFKKLPIVLSLGEKVTSASILGIAGQAGNYANTGQRWQGRLFGAAAFVVSGPKKSALIFGSEFAQQPRYIQGLDNALEARVTIPTSLSYFVRVVPHLKGSPLQVDLGVVQAAGKILKEPVVDVAARARVGMGISYHF